MADDGVTLPLGGDAGAAAAEARGPGRPAGALNRKTRALGPYLQSVLGERYRDPALVLATQMSMTVGEVVQQLGCEPLEAKKLILDAAEGLMPYLHGKMPTEVIVSDERLPILVLGGRAPVQQLEERAVRPLSIGRPWSEQNQGVTDAEPVQSHDGKSHE